MGCITSSSKDVIRNVKVRPNESTLTNPQVPEKQNDPFDHTIVDSVSLMKADPTLLAVNLPDLKMKEIPDSKPLESSMIGKKEKMPSPTNKQTERKLEEPKEREEVEEEDLEVSHPLDRKKGSKKPQPKANKIKKERSTVYVDKNEVSLVKEEPEEPVVEKEIYYNFRKVGNQKYDDVFSKASSFLASAEKVRSDIEDSKQKSIELSNTFMLKEYSLLETIKVLLWTVSANSKGKIAQRGIKVDSEPPFLHLPQVKKMMEEAQKLYDFFSKYLKTLVTGEAIIKKAEQALTELQKEANELAHENPLDCSADIEDVLSRSDRERVILYASRYLPNELEKVKKIIPLIEKEMNELKEIAPQLQELLDKADEVGAKVHIEYTTQLKNTEDPELADDIEFILAPARIFNLYSSKETKSPAEVEAYMLEVKNAQEMAIKARAARERKDRF